MSPSQRSEAGEQLSRAERVFAYHTLAGFAATLKSYPAAKPATERNIIRSSSHRRTFGSVLLAALFFFAGGLPARADVSLLVEEPFGRFGGMNPTGHAALYFDGICAASPTQLRPCRPGELGAVVSRYHKIGGYDWLAMPIVPYLYAVDEPRDIPATATPELEAQLRDQYRREHLGALAPDTAAGTAPDGEWIQLVGSAYDRTIHGFTVRTTAEQDARVIALFNDRKNVSHFNLFFNNCADLSRATLNLYYPHLIHRNFVADVGFTTPKQAAKLMTHYGRKHPEAGLRTFIIPQVPGTIERSTKVRGVLESLVKSKRYALPLAYLLPHTTAGMALAYFGGGGRFRFPKDGDVWTPDMWTNVAAVAPPPGTSATVSSEPAPSPEMEYTGATPARVNSADPELKTPIAEPASFLGGSEANLVDGEPKSSY